MPAVLPTNSVGARPSILYRYNMLLLGCLDIIFSHFLKWCWSIVTGGITPTTCTHRYPRKDIKIDSSMTHANTFQQPPGRRVQETPSVATIPQRVRCLPRHRRIQLLKRVNTVYVVSATNLVAVAPAGLATDQGFTVPAERVAAETLPPGLDSEEHSTVHRGAVGSADCWRKVVGHHLCNARGTTNG